jgi:hypothetical protein
MPLAARTRPPTRLGLLIRIEAEFLELPIPFGVGIPQALNIDAAGKAPFDRCLDELRRKECE